MKVAVHTLGCKNNQLESSTIVDDFKMNGWEIVDFEEAADIYIINTCTVTAKSDSHSRAAIRKAHKRNKQAKIIVTGCYAQTSSDEIAEIEGVSLVTGNLEKVRIYELAKEIMNSSSQQIIVSDIQEQKSFEDKKVYSASGRTRINVKIQDGCNYRCSYCIVPVARGKSRSNSPQNVIKQISDVAYDFPEVILTGIHLGQYGLDFKPLVSLSSLLKDLIKIEHLQRLRLSSIDPLEITEELMDVILGTDKICRHLHISLQSGNDKVLKAMKRRYTVEKYSNIIDNLVKEIDGIAIGSDIIVGFPGESDEDFEETVNNLKILPISYLHVFTYSKRKGTEAAMMDNQVSPEIKKERNKLLKTLSKEKNLLFRGQFKDKILKIIPEYERDKISGNLKGLSDNYIQVTIEGEDSLKGKIVPVEITSVTKNNTFGKVSY